MGKIHVLVVEDEADIQQLVSYNLIRAGFSVTCADDGEEALEKLRCEDIDCLLLDVMLPGISGIDVCRAVREGKSGRNRLLPVVMLTAKGEEEDIVSGFDCGADDYITKPFSPKVLIARIKAVIQRAGAAQSKEKNGQGNVISVNGLHIDRRRYEVHINGRKVTLTRTEFALLCLLATRPGWVFSRQQIIDSVRGYGFLVTPRAIDVQVFGLRKKLGEYGKNIETVRGIGYRYNGEDAAE